MKKQTLSQKERLEKKQIVYSNWSTKICECCDEDCGMFLFGCVCANTSIPQMFERLVSKGYCLAFTLVLWSSFTLALTIPIYVYSVTNIYGIIFGTLSLVSFTCLSVFLVYKVRNKLRIKKNIKGNELDDFCTSLWCCYCAHMQHMREDGLTIDNYNLNSANAV